CYMYCFFFQAEDGIRDFHVTGVQTCALPISVFVPTVDRGQMQGNFGRYAVAFLAVGSVVNITGFPTCVLIFCGCQNLPGDLPGRSEERRVGKECRSRWKCYH